MVSDGLAMTFAVETETPVAVVAPLRHPPKKSAGALAMLLSQPTAPVSYLGRHVSAPKAPVTAEQLAKTANLSVSTGPYPTQKTSLPAVLVGESMPPSGVLHGATLSDWLRPEGVKYPAFLLMRKPWWKDCQEVVDQAAIRGDFGEKDQIKVIFSRGGVEGLQDLHEVAEKLLEQLTLPKDLREAVRNDVLDVGATVAGLCPWSRNIDIKLECIGENSCAKWHADNYCARAIVTYNSEATLYTPHENVDFWELEKCGCNDKILKDQSKACALGVGDVLFMKGRKFPHGEKGLVHRSPDVQYHENGLVVNRLVLKVDVH